MGNNVPLERPVRGRKERELTRWYPKSYAFVSYSLAMVAASVRYWFQRRQSWRVATTRMIFKGWSDTPPLPSGQPKEEVAIEQSC